MTRKRSTLSAEWEQFVLQHGWRALLADLAAVLGQSENDIRFVRSSGACVRHAQRKGFSELFTLWHGSPPQDTDWPPPRKSSAGVYTWQTPELALLATLVGTLGPKEIAQVLSTRLIKVTGDKKAKRTKESVILQTNRIGLTSADLVGGLTTTQAGKEIGSLAIVNQAIAKKQLRVERVGRYLKIPYAVWNEWKSKRVFPPEGYVQLSTIKAALAIKSDKLSEFARASLIPTAVRCNPYGTGVRSTQFGTWYIDPKVAEQLLSDRRAGGPMPWHAKPNLDNMKATYKLWSLRKHPSSCSTCADIWGEQGVPKTFEAYQVQYPPLAHGAKRHLTRVWDPGLTLKEVATFTERSIHYVRSAIANGMLEVSLQGRTQYVSRTNATRWKARKCPTGDNEKSWITLPTAETQYLFTQKELRKFIKSGELFSKVGTEGAQRGIVYVSRHQCGQLREKLGFTEEQAATRVGVTVGRFRVLLEGVNWRKGDGIPLATVQAVVKRLGSREGYTIEEASIALKTTEQWVRERIQDGTVRVTRAKWDRRRLYLTKPMVQRLEKALASPKPAKPLGKEWLSLSGGAGEAGVSTATLIHWAEAGEIERRQSSIGWRYHQEAVRARARIYWETVRFHRAVPPEWLRRELQARSTSSRARAKPSRNRFAGQGTACLQA